MSAVHPRKPCSVALHGRRCRRRAARQPLRYKGTAADKPRRYMKTGTALALLLLLGACASPETNTQPRSGLIEKLSGRNDAPWSILCLETSDLDGKQRVRDVAAILQRTPGVRPDAITLREDRDGSSRLYYGTYARRADPRTGRRPMPDAMRRDLDLLREFGTEDGRRFFVQAIPVRLPPPDVGPRDRDLRNVHAAYSLQVGIFEPTDDFSEYKQAAVEFCDLLREKGFEAYYYHTPVSSTVTVGAFGTDAAIRRPDGRNDYSATVRALQQNELLRYNLVNGGVMRVKDPQGGFHAVPSQLVEVPQHD